MFGSLGAEGLFSETTPYAPNSPYSASKAGADHLVRAYFHTYGLPTLITNCSNNYGPYQFPEKLIPLMILNALDGEPLPVYGDGGNVRDWLHVEDHCAAITAACCAQGRAGRDLQCRRRQRADEPRHRRPDLRVARGALPGSGNPAMQAAARRESDRHSSPIGQVTIGAMRSTRPRSASELGWRPQHGFDDGLRTTVALVSGTSGVVRRSALGYDRGRLGLSTSSV